MKMVSLDATHEVMAKAGTNCHWGEVGSEQAQEAVKDPIRFGAEFTRFLQNSGRVIVISTDGIVPPEGGVIQILSVPVDESWSWRDAVKAAGPDTGRACDIWKVGDQSPPIADVRPSLKQVILVNFGKDKVVQSEEALVWGKGQKLKPTTPRTVFAVSEHFHCYLDKPMVVVITLLPSSFEGCQRVPVVWRGGARRKAYLDRFDNGWFDHFWFAFDRE